MTMKMIMLGAMYAPSDKVTLMGMAMFNDKEMTLDTHQGMMQRNILVLLRHLHQIYQKFQFQLCIICTILMIQDGI